MIIRAEEAKKISDEKNSQLKNITVPEALVLINNVITKHAEAGLYHCSWLPSGDYNRWIKDIASALLGYGYNSSVDYDEDHGYYLNIWW